MNDFVHFWEQKISAFNPFPQDDENTPLLGPNPCTLDRAALKYTNAELSELLNWVQRHVNCLPGYCQVKRKVPGHDEPQVFCRFDYPFECRTEAGIGHNTKKQVRFDPRHNDPLLNTYNPTVILAWRANIDLKPVMSKDAAINYVAKYASKSEKQAPAFPELLHDIVSKIDSSGSAQVVCQKLLNKMLGERSYSAQETVHLLLGIPLVCSSVTFQTIYLGKDGEMRELQVECDNSGDTEDGNEGSRHVTGDSWLQRYMKHGADMEDLSLQEVLEMCSWQRGGWKKCMSSQAVVRAFPCYSPNPESKQYDAFCCIKILLHHPFRNLDQLRLSQQGEEMTWSQLLAHCSISHDHRKDTLRRWEDESRIQEDDKDEELVNPDIVNMEEDDWQRFAHDHPNLAVLDAGNLESRPLDAGWDINVAWRWWSDANQMGTYLQE
ncbi:hypothetical protein C8J56DRAFT_888136 [Mycena floridula]|nr:hypothetical protein C8J56DRAFT_888136 [Mycena floridula]